MSQKKLNDEQINPTFGIITALPKEYVAVLALIDNPRDYIVPGRGSGRKYIVGSVTSAGGGIHCIVLLLLPDMGNNLSSALTASLFSYFPNVNTVIMTGIAGGIPNPSRPDEHVRLGDIVATNQKGVIQYDNIKETSDGVTIRNPPRPPSAILLEAARLLEANELLGERPWLHHIERALAKLPQALRPRNRIDVLYSSSNPDESIPHPKDQKRIAKTPRLFLGPIASANILLKNPEKRDLLRDQLGVRAIEMEGSGVSDASWLQSKEYFIVRGICDYCDSHKSDAWQEYAAVVAAAFTRSLLEAVEQIVSIEPSTPSRKSTARISSKDQKKRPDERPVYSLDLYGDHDQMLRQMDGWTFVSTDASAKWQLSGDHIDIGSTQSSTFNLSPVKPLRNCRVSCQIKIVDDGGDPSNWAGIRVRGFGYDVSLGYLVYLRSSGGIELYSVGNILGGKDQNIIPDTKKFWTKIEIEIIDSSIRVSVNDVDHITTMDERFCGRDQVFLHTLGSRAQFRNFQVYDLD